MKDHNKETEIDFTDEIQQLEFDFMSADEKAGYPPKCNEGYEEKDGKCVKKESEASEEDKCDNENCGNCGCEKEESEAEEKKEEKEMVEVEEHDVNCPSCGCALGRMWMKAGVMRRPAYASKYSELYEKVKSDTPEQTDS
tara:strand:+ start:2235 stop:2654 length:420 start_codon:yes stop_codon:yes gene_type:complete